MAAIFKSNRDFDSTIIVVGIHLLLFAILGLHAFDKLPENTGLETNILLVYGMIASYFFKSQIQKNGAQNGNEKENP